MAIRPASTRELIDNMISNYNRQNDLAEIEEQKRDNEYHDYLAFKESVLKAGCGRDNAIARRSSFAQNVKSSFLTAALSNIVESCLSSRVVKSDDDAFNTVYSITSQYVNEHGAESILRRMNSAGPLMHETAEVVDKTYKTIMRENQDVKPGDFVVPDDVKDNFYDNLDLCDADNVTNAIRERINDSMQDFLQKNAEEKEQIKSVLDATNEQIAKHKDDGEEVQESYAQMGKRYVANIRSKDHGLFHNMVTTMCESVIKNPDLQEKFMESGKLNIGKIVDKCEIAYTFMEAMASLRLANRDVLAEEALNDIKR